MHRPPAVSHTAGRSRWHLRLLLGLLLTAWAPFFLLFQSQPPLLWLFAVAWLLSAVFALRAWWMSPSGLLQWDGESWHWMERGEGLTCRVQMVWDLQHLVLARMIVEHARSSRWLWLEPGSSPNQWNALRRALVDAHGKFTDSSPTEA